MRASPGPARRRGGYVLARFEPPPFHTLHATLHARMEIAFMNCDRVLLLLVVVVIWTV